MVGRIAVVLDTNVLVASLSSRSPYHCLIEALLNETFDAVVSHDILLEYEEILKQKYHIEVAEAFLRALKELPNIRECQVYYQWKLLHDEDDDKFIDAAVVANAHAIVTEDRVFNALSTVPFQKLRYSPYKALSKFCGI